MKLRAAILIACLCTLSYVVRGQDDKISKTPVTSEPEINKTLFNLDTLDINYYFRANLPDNNFFTIEFKNIGYWPEKGFIRQVFNTAREVASNVADSFTNPGNSKRIDINIPIAYEPLTVRLTEHVTSQNVLMMDKDGTMPLKIGMDTIRVLKTFAKIKEKKYESLVQVQYTFILKDLDQINALANEQVIDSVETAFDNLIEKKKEKWMFPRAWYNGLSAVYDPYNPKAKEIMTTEGAGGMANGISVDANVGVSLFRNELAPNISYGLNYKWLRKDKDYMYAGLSASVLALFERFGNKIEMYDVSFINAEWGTKFTKPNTIIPVYSTSIGFRYLLRNQHNAPTVPGDGYGMFFKYSLSRATSFSFDVYFLEPEESSWGLSVYFNLFRVE